MDRKPASQFIALIGLVLSLVIAYGFDAWTTQLRTDPQVASLGTIILGVYALSRLLVAAAFLWLFWYLLTATPKGWTLPVVFIVLGLLIVFSPLYNFNFIQPASPTSLLFTAGALSASAGILKLVLHGKRREITP